MTRKQVPALAHALIPLLRQLVIGEYGIALGGAHAKGVDDTESDLDLYVFAQSALPNAERSRITALYSADISQLVSWGPDSPFEQGGTDFYFRGTKVECWLRSSDMMERTIAECLEGRVTRQLVTWTTTGFYNHVALSDLKVMVPLEDPAGMLARWKLAISEYPSRLRETIINQHLAAARFWPHNYHYTSAVQREDVIYTTGIVAQVVHNLIQVLFAVNNTYFPGDKKLDAALSHLEVLPEGCVERIKRLLWPGEGVTAAVLREQQAELQRLTAEVSAIAGRL